MLLLSLPLDCHFFSHPCPPSPNQLLLLLLPLTRQVISSSVAIEMLPNSEMQ